MTGDQVIARLFFEMTRVIHKTYMPDTRFGTFLDLVPVGYAIFLGQAEGRPMGLTGLARFLDIPRSSVQRRIDMLIEQGIVERRALKYEFASSALTGPRAVGAHRQIVRMFLSAARQVAPDEPAKPSLYRAATEQARVSRALCGDCLAASSETSGKAGFRSLQVSRLIQTPPGHLS